jgi:hypothetical protein
MGWWGAAAVAAFRWRRAALEGEEDSGVDLQAGEKEGQARGELNGRNVEGCVLAAILTGDGGDSGTAVEFAKGEAVATL